MISLCSHEESTINDSISTAKDICAGIIFIGNNQGYFSSCAPETIRVSLQDR